VTTSPSLYCSRQLIDSKHILKNWDILKCPKRQAICYETFCEYSNTSSRFKLIANNKNIKLSQQNIKKNSKDARGAKEMNTGREITQQDY